MPKAKTAPGAAAAVVEPEEEKADVGQLSKDGKSPAVAAPKTSKNEKADQPAKPFKAILTFTSPLKAFTAALAPLARATAPAKSTYPICANVLLSVKDGRLTLITTNMEMTIVETIEVQVQPALMVNGPTDTGPVEVTLPYRLLADLLGTMSGDSVTIAFSEDRAVIQCGGSHSEIMGIPAREFPSVERTAKDLPFCFTAGDFKQATRQVEFAASTDESRPVLQGVLVTPAYDSKKEVVGLTLAATDGFRVAVKTIGFSEPPEGPVANFSTIIPAGAMAEVGRLIANPDSFVTFGFKNGKAVFSYENLVISVLTLDGKFPDVNMILPKAYKTHMVVSTSALFKAMKQAEVMAKNGNNVVRLTLNTTQDETPENLTLWAQSTESGEIETKLATTIEGPGMEIAFNVRFSKEALEAVTTPLVALDTNDHKSPARIKGVGDDTHFVVIMPMHLG
jgi:DNA polymerase-3 subunit beta